MIVVVAAGGWRQAWLSFVFGIVLSLCANVAAAPKLSVFAIAVAACPPLALLLSVKLLNRALKRHYAETRHKTTEETGRAVTLSLVSGNSRPARERSAQQTMWAYYQSERANGRSPTGAELDRIASTNNYGRRVIAAVAQAWLDPTCAGPAIVSHCSGRICARIVSEK